MFNADESDFDLAVLGRLAEAFSDAAKRLTEMQMPLQKYVRNFKQYVFLKLFSLIIVTACTSSRLPKIRTISTKKKR